MRRATWVLLGFRNIALGTEKVKRTQTNKVQLIAGLNIIGLHRDTRERVITSQPVSHTLGMTETQPIQLLTHIFLSNANFRVVC